MIFRAASNFFEFFLVVGSPILGALFCVPERTVDCLVRLWPVKQGRAILGRAGTHWSPAYLPSRLPAAVVATTAFNGAQVNEARRAGV